MVTWKRVRHVGLRGRPDVCRDQRGHASRSLAALRGPCPPAISPARRASCGQDRWPRRLSHRPCDLEAYIARAYAETERWVAEHPFTPGRTRVVAPLAQAPVATVVCAIARPGVANLRPQRQSHLRDLAPFPTNGVVPPDIWVYSSQAVRQLPPETRSHLRGLTRMNYQELS